MAKVLISWMAYENDFIRGKGMVNPDGPNVAVHSLYYEYDYHILLTSAEYANDDTRYQHIVSYLRNKFDHEIVEFAVNVDDIINFNQINAKITSLLLDHKNDEIDIFVSPGTATMQVVWYFAHKSLGLKTRLFQLRNPLYTHNKVPEQIWIDLEQSPYTSTIFLKQQLLDQPIDYSESDCIITPILGKIYHKAKKISLYDHIRVLILGETGTGKELLARYIHKCSPRNQKPFAAVNCSAFGDVLLESRLFGYVKGAFTGANSDTHGLFKQLDGGTIFLDEIGDISPYMQQTLLRVIQNGEFLPIGSGKTEQVNVRVIAATNRDLATMCDDKEFRHDLYYRLAVSILKLPSLAEYPISEKEQIFQYLWEKSNSKFNRKAPTINKDITRRIVEYEFPGNIREMENAIDSILAEAEDEIQIAHLPERIISPSNSVSFKLIDVENNHIQRILKLCSFNKHRAAKILGIARNTLESRIREYNLID